ncbi:MAG: glycosyltransferase [Planctomycetaceae bacterium]|nr:glycosyltransferase [Planctomycetaceae bacterium]
MRQLTDRLSRPFLVEALFKRLRRFCSPKAADQLEQILWWCTGHNRTAGAVRSLGFTAEFHGPLTEGFRTGTVKEEPSGTGAEHTTSPETDTIIVHLPASAGSGQQSKVARHVSQLPWPVSDGFTPLGFRVTPSRRFAAVCTGPQARAPLDPEGRPAKLLTVPNLAALRSEPDSWRRRFQQYRGLLDHADNHRNLHLRAAVLSHAAAVGLPVCLSDDRGLRGFLPDEVLDQWLNVSPADLRDPCLRQRIAFSQWSTVRNTLSMRPMWNRLLASSGTEVLPCRRISVLLATRRPGMIRIWAPLLASQNYPDFEVIAALHGSAFTGEDEAAARAWLGDRLTVVRVPDRCVLGEVLNRATAAASGELVVKWDDDDLYSTRHLSDLAGIYEHAGTPIVGKTIEFIYLASSDCTLRLSLNSTERRGTFASGNTLCLAREDLLKLGGWQPVPNSVDTRLIREMFRQGGQLYRAAGFGHLVLRSLRGDHRHTWKVKEKFLRRYTRDERPGADANFAMVDAPADLLARWAYPGQPATRQESCVA